MHQAMDWDAIGRVYVPKWPTGVADHITVELHNSTSYGTIEYSAPDVELSINGTAHVTVPSIHNASYYVTIKNRNSIETTTALPVSFSGASPVSYTFDLKTKAYGNNMGVMIDGTAVIYAGDENQDGLIDGTDLNDIGNQNDVFASGYLIEDINGDGLVDGTDLNITGNNNDSFVAKIHP